MAADAYIRFAGEWRAREAVELGRVPRHWCEDDLGKSSLLSSSQHKVDVATREEEDPEKQEENAEEHKLSGTVSL